MRALTTMLRGLAFPEGPRWHEGRLWFSDMHADEVVAVDPDGTCETITTVENQPSGLGWLPDGRLLIVSMTDRRVLRREPDGTLVTHADLTGLARWHCNDMVVDSFGRAYVGNFGFDLHGPNPKPCTTELILVGPDGSARVVAEELSFPNGMVITPDGATIIVGESSGGCLTAFRISDDGSLSDRRTWASLEKGTAPDGICLDAEGAIWSACPRTGVVQRIREGSEVIERIQLETDSQAYACMLGGPHGTTLYICASQGANPSTCRHERKGRIVSVEVDVPHAGMP